MVKADGCVAVHSDGGAYKPLNWMSPPCALVIDDGDEHQRWVVTNKAGETLTITVLDVHHDSHHELGVDPGLVKDIAGRTDTRFLIITHHAVTMARMDRLFGVTMAEQGVSQLVSVDLKTESARRRVQANGRQVIALFKRNGALADSVKAEIIPGILPSGRKNVAGLMTGTPEFNWRSSGSTIRQTSPAGFQSKVTSPPSAAELHVMT